MPGTNEILPFASTNTGTNLLTQAEYTSDAQRTTGNQPGIARSKLVNKALRQASLIAAGLAEFIADYQANNVTDSLTPQNIADYLLAAITANIPVVPDASDTVKGKIEIATAAEAQTFASSLLALTPSALNQALKGSNQSLSSSGYQRLPGGLILQWGTVVFVVPDGIGTRIQTNFNFPIAFPSVCVNLSASPYYITDEVTESIMATEILSSSSGRIYAQRVSGNSGNYQQSGVYYLAIGY